MTEEQAPPPVPVTVEQVLREEFPAGLPHEDYIANVSRTRGMSALAGIDFQNLRMHAGIERTLLIAQQRAMVADLHPNQAETVALIEKLLFAAQAENVSARRNLRAAVLEHIEKYQIGEFDLSDLIHELEEVERRLG